MAFLAFLMVAPVQGQVPDAFAVVDPTVAMADERLFELQTEALDMSVEASDAVADATGDEDRDGLPDALESEICRRALIADAINTLNDNDVAPVATCGSDAPWEFTPYPHKTQVRQYSSVSGAGPDNDRDGFPEYVRINYRTQEIDPFSPERIRQVGTGSIFPEVDTNDADPNVPVISEMTLPVILTTMITFHGDADRDGVPTYAEFERVGVHFDRRNAADQVVSFPAASSTQEVLDEDDSNPNAPAQSEFSATIPVMLVRAPSFYDNDDDYVPGTARVWWTDMFFDRRDGANGLVLENRFSTVTVSSENDGDSGAPAPVLDTIDGDRDGMIDQLEPGICDVEDRGRPEDGSCDLARSDYAPLVDAYVNPWNEVL